MRNIIVIILVLIGFSSFGQNYLVQPAPWKFTKGVRFDSTFRIFNLPTFTGDTIIAFNPYTKKIGLKILSSSGGTWGSITGTLSNQTDLQTALNLKLNISDTAAMLSPYALSSEVPTYLAGRGITKSGVTFRLDTTQFYTWTNSRTRWNAAPTASPNYGLVSLGSGAFDGATSGFFIGNASGTVLAVNAVSGFAGDLINLQTAGVHTFKASNLSVTTRGDYNLYRSDNTLIYTFSNSGGVLDFNPNQSSIPSIRMRSNSVVNLFYYHGNNNAIGLGDAPVANEEVVQITGRGQTGTSAFGALKITQTWNTTGNPTAIKLNVTNTASGTTSKLLDLQVGSTSLFNVDKVGNTLATKYSISALNTAPSSASDTGTLGEIRVTATYIYVCTATNTWVRTALATW